MKTAELPSASKSVNVAPRWIEVALSDDPNLAPLLLPPLEDISEIASLQGECFSIADHSERAWSAVQFEFANELRLAEEKATRFPDAPAYMFRLADLAFLAGDRKREREYLERARTLGHRNYANRRIGENLLADGDSIAAENIFRQFNLEADDYANLRLAYFHMLRQEFAEAKIRVAKAVEISPLSFSGRLFEGALFLACGDFYRAIRSFRVAEEERPNSSTLKANMAVAYIQLGQEEKALQCLKKAIAIDPLNKNAIALLADYSARLGRFEEPVSCLRYFLQLEESDSEMWARLARSLAMLGESLGALAALRKQASLKEDAAVWNNLGAVYWALGEKEKAGRTFIEAIRRGELEDDGNHFNLLFASRSLALALVHGKQYKPAVKLVSDALSWDKEGIARTDRILSDLYAVLFASHVKLGELEQAGRLAAELLSHSSTCLHLRAWTVTASIDTLVRENGQIETASTFITPAMSLLNELAEDGKHETDRMRLANNVAYLYAEAGRLDDAQRVVGIILKQVHKDPFATATLGLINLRKGHVNRGVALYQEAHRIAKGQENRRQIRQKLNLELGRALQSENPKRAMKALQHAAEEKGGIAWFQKEAGRLLAALK